MLIWVIPSATDGLATIAQVPAEVGLSDKTPMSAVVPFDLSDAIVEIISDFHNGAWLQIEQQATAVQLVVHVADSRFHVPLVESHECLQVIAISCNQRVWVVDPIKVPSKGHAGQSERQPDSCD